MSPLVLGLVLAAAFAHAGWNLLAKGAEGGAAFVWLCAAIGTLLYVPVLALALGTDPGPRSPSSTSGRARSHSPAR